MRGTKSPKARKPAKRAPAKKAAPTKKRTIVPKAAPAKKRKVAPKAAPAKKRKAAPKPTPKKRKVAPKAAPAKKRKVAPKAAPAKKRKAVPKPKKRTVKKRIARLRKQAANVVKAQQAARGTPKRSPARKKASTKKKALVKAVQKTRLVTKELPRATSKQRSRSIKSDTQAALENFRRILRHGKRTKQTPKHMRQEVRAYQSRRWEGQRTYVRVESIVDERSLEEILYQVNQAARRLSSRNVNTWYAVLSFSSMGDVFYGSGGKIIDVTGMDDLDDVVDAAAFQVQGYSNTGLMRTREAMLIEIETLLSGYAEETSALVYLHGVRMQAMRARRDRDGNTL